MDWIANRLGKTFIPMKSSFMIAWGPAAMAAMIAADIELAIISHRFIEMRRPDCYTFIQ
jgi:hypothetical protein